MARPAILYNDAFAAKWVAYLSPDNWRQNVTIQFLDVPFSALQPAGCHTDPDVVDGWYALLQSGKAVAPFIVSATPNGEFYIHDGNHRYEAVWAYLGENSDTTVRVALVKPNSGFRFYAVPVDRQVVTYELQPVYRWKTARLVGLPLVSTALAAIFTLLLPSAEPTPFFALMIAAVLVSARFGGFLPGMIAVLGNTFAAAFFMLPPLRSIAIEDQVHAVQLIVSIVVMLAIVVLSLQWKSGLLPARFWKGMPRWR